MNHFIFYVKKGKVANLTCFFTIFVSKFLLSPNFNIL